MSTYEQEELWRSAKALVGDKATQAVLQRIQDRIVAEWMGSSPEASAKRDDAYHMVRAIAAFRDELTALAAEPSVMQFNRRLNRA
jgi:hypothetical protein